MPPSATLLKDEGAATAVAYGRMAPASVAANVPGLSAFGPKPRTAITVDPNLFERFAITATFVVISAAYFYAAISRASTDYFWMDEVLAVSAASQSSLSQVWHAIWVGTDFSPPTYHFLLHGLMKAVGAADSRLVWRVPSIVAVYGAALCSYALVRKSHLSRFAAVLAFAIVLAFGLFDYAIQVRQYALLALGLAAALLIWSGLEEPRGGKARACWLWLVLAACLCLHFYGVIVVATIGTAELIYWISRQRFRVTVWMALLLTAPVEAALYPLAAHLATFNAGDALAPAYYATPSLGGFVRAVIEVIGGGVPGMLVLLAAVAMLAVADFMRRSNRRPAPAAKPVQTGRRLSAIEIAMIALCLLPLMSLAFSVLVTKSFSARYIAGGALLPAVAAAYVVDKSWPRRFAALALVPLLAGILVVRSHAPDPVADALTVVHKAAPGLPIVVGEGLLYIELMQAADAGTRTRLVYLTKPEGAVSPDPTNENEVVRLAAFHPEYRVSGENAFLKGNAAFYVLHRPDRTTDLTTPALAAKGLLGRPVQSENGVLLFRSSPPAAMQPGRGGQ